MGIPQTHRDAVKSFFGAARDGIGYTVSKVSGKTEAGRRESLSSQGIGGPRENYNASFEHETSDMSLAKI